MTNAPSTIAVLGASGLIGAAIAEGLLQEGLRVIAVARRFTAAQITAFGVDAVTCPVADCTTRDLHDLLRSHGVDVVVNCLGVLQDGPRGSTANIHEAFVARLLDAIRSQPTPPLLVHLSIPGRQADDMTDFSRSKRAGERLIAAGGVPFLVLRPGLVVAPAAYGGSALVRALAATPLTLPAALGARPFAVTSVDDIVRTVGVVAQRWTAGERHWKAVWDICERQPRSVATVIEAFRARFGGPAPRFALPLWLLWIGAWTGDAVARLGWSPPVRTTALQEMLRGVEGRPEDWIAATNIAPASLTETLRRVPTTVQERWFARLFLLKPLILVTLAVFWVVSGLIALTVAFAPASAILIAHGLSPAPANGITVVSSFVDIAVGIAVTFRRSCRAGLLAGIAVSLFYMAGAAVLTPDLWTEPLGALVKTGPAIVLMMVALAVLETR